MLVVKLPPAGSAPRRRRSAAEAALAPLLRSRRNTDGWHLEMAQRLMHLAEGLARDGQFTRVPALSSRALEHVAAALQRTNDPSRLAAAHAFAGRVHEKFTGDRQAAITSYQAALSHRPGSMEVQRKLASLRADPPASPGGPRQ